MKRKLLLWPLLSLFIVGCNGSDSPFADDEYQPIGMTPTHQIVRPINAEEEELLDDSFATTDMLLNSISMKAESRFFAKKALPNHITASTYDERISINYDWKRYENDVVVIEQDVLTQKLYTGSLISSMFNLAYYAALNDDDTEVTTTIDITDEGGDNVVTSNTSAYDQSTDYEQYFVSDLQDEIWDNVYDGYVGTTDNDLIAAIIVESSVTDIADAVQMDDGSRYIIETNNLFEAYFAKGVLDDEVTEYYYVSYARIYTENLIVSEAIPNIASESITYLSRPIVLAYNEQIISASIASNGNFVTSQIPEATV